jgi:hypothetical protein
MSVSVRIVMFREIAHEAVSQRLPVSFGTMVARTRMHTYAAKVGALSLVQGQIFCRPVPNRSVPIRDFCIAERRLTLASAALADFIAASTMSSIQSLYRAFKTPSS